MKNKLLLALCIPISISMIAIALAEDTDGIRASYSNSAELPVEIAYGEFLGFVERDKEDEHRLDIEIVAQALGLLHEKDSKKAKQRTKFFQKSLRALEREQLQAKYSVLCDQSPTSRTEEGMYRALNAADDIRQAVLAKHFLTDISQLPAAEQEALLAYLDNLKYGISYMKVDSRQLKSRQTEDIRYSVERDCQSQPDKTMTTEEAE